jgi:ubiquinone/menaquinone biosynthesis C-methylase UbiE
MRADRDVSAFDRRARGYDSGALGRWHRDLVRRALAIATDTMPAPRRVLDLGTGSGVALALLAHSYPHATTILGLDPAAGMITVARAATADRRVRLARAGAERLPLAGGTCDLVIATTTFDHWADQRAGLAECRRVLSPAGVLVLTDLIGTAVIPTLLRRPGKARTRRRLDRLLNDVGLIVTRRHATYRPVIQTVVARPG